MSHDNIFVNSAFFFLDGHHGNGVLRPVHARANYFGHSGIGFDKFVPVFPGIYHINCRCHDCAGICDEICAGFPLPGARRVRSVPRSFQTLLPCGARLSANLWIPRPACARPCTRLPDSMWWRFQIQRKISTTSTPRAPTLRDRCPIRYACAWSLMVKSRCLQILWTSEIYSCQIPKLDAGPPTLVRLLCPDPQAGIDTHGEGSPGEQVAISSQLIQRTRIEDHALFDQVFQIFGYLLRRKHDVRDQAHRPAWRARLRSHCWRRCAIPFASRCEFTVLLGKCLHRVARG